MKILAVFMSVVMLLTGFEICEENNSCASEGKTEITTLGSEKHAETAEVCGPFCNCARCSFSVLISEIIKETSLYLFNLISFKLFTDISSTSVNSSIWQPPKMSSIF